MTEVVDTLIVGGGQAGLATSACLRRHGIAHLILERRRIGDSWLSDRWESFTLVSPAWTIRLPDFAHPGDEPERFLPREEIVAWLEEYARQIEAPVRTGVEVTRLVQEGDGFLASTTQGEIRAHNVVVATSSFGKPRLPVCAAKISPRVLRLHSGAYRNASQLPPGSVLVVGSGQSGLQIAQDLLRAGRNVYLSTGKGVWFPRRFRGKDAFFWGEALGLFKQPVTALPTPAARFDTNPQLTGRDGGKTINLHLLARAGAHLAGRLTDADGEQVWFADDLRANLELCDAGNARFMAGATKVAEAAGIADDGVAMPTPRDGYEAEPVLQLDLAAADVGAIIWCTGYLADFHWIDLPIFDEFGYPRHENGASEAPGLYFVGLHFLSRKGSALLAGVGEDAAYVAEQVAQRSK